MKTFILGIIVTLLVIGLAFGAYQIGKQSTQNQPAVTQVTPNPTPTTVPVQTIAPSSTPQLTTQPTNDSDLIKQALIKKNNWPQDTQITVTLSFNDGKYAKGTAGSQGGGGYVFAAKVNNVWQIVADGNGVILCSALTNYPDFPKTLIPECFDQATSKTVTR